MNRVFSPHWVSMLVLALSVSTPSLAEDAAYKSDDIINFFSKTRGICVGTLEECEPKPQESKDPLGFNLQVTFELNSAELTEQAQANLAEFTKALQDERLNQAKFAVEGYTDASGSEQYNLSLSERRAQSVVAYLMSQGVSAEKLVPLGFGEKAPRMDDPFDPGNRRVETRLIRE